MSIRANLLEISDLQNAISYCEKQLENLSLFEMGQHVRRKEKKEVAEERRKRSMSLQFYVGQVEALERENRLVALLYLCLFIFVIFLRVLIFTPQRVELKEMSSKSHQPGAETFSIPDVPEDEDEMQFADSDELNSPGHYENGESRGNGQDSHPSHANDHHADHQHTDQHHQTNDHDSNNAHTHDHTNVNNNK